jgi:hypothetical protein
MTEGALDETAHPLELVGVVERPVVGIVVVRAADRRAFGLLDECGQQIAMDAGPGQHPRRGSAILPGVEIAGPSDPFGGRTGIGVVEDDDRCLAAELKVHTLERGGGCCCDLHAGAH